MVSYCSSGVTMAYTNKVNIIFNGDITLIRHDIGCAHSAFLSKLPVYFNTIINTELMQTWNILEIFANKNCENIERVHMLDIFRIQCYTKAIPWSFLSAKYVCIWLPKLIMILLYHTLLSCTGCQLEGRCMDDFYLSTVGIVFCAQPPVSNSNKTYAIHISPFRDPSNVTEYGINLQRFNQWTDRHRHT